MEIRKLPALEVNLDAIRTNAEALTGLCAQYGIDVAGVVKFSNCDPEVAKAYAAGTQQQCIRLPYSKDEMGFAIGRQELAMAAITDAALALAMVQALPEVDKYAETIAVLTDRVQKQKQRKKEAAAHKKNVRIGKKK